MADSNETGATPGTTLLGPQEVRHLLDLNEVMQALSDGFIAVSTGTAVVPPRIAVSVPEAGFITSMPGYVPGMNVTVKLVSVFESNAGTALPTHQAIISLFDSSDGRCVCIMSGTFLTAYRTAAASALTAHHLARSDARVLAIIGAGVQAEMHLSLLPEVRQFDKIYIASRTESHAHELARHHPNAEATAIEAAVRAADVIALCTQSADPVLDPSWVNPGAHVMSIGFAPPGGELPRELAVSGRLYVESRVAFSPPPAGCAELTGLDPGSGTELGELLLNPGLGRSNDSEITVYKSMGHAVEDAAAAHVAYRRARSQELGNLVQM